MTSALRKALWWAADYAYVTAWQIRSLAGPAASTYLSGDGRPVLVIPGVFERWAFMRPLIRALHDAGHPVHVVATLGLNGRSIEKTTTLVADHVTKLNLDNVVIVAHSKGGLIGADLMTLPATAPRIAAMVAIATPFTGSSYARFLPLRSLRDFAPTALTTAAALAPRLINTRIVSIFGCFDPHIPETSELPGARNIELPTGGHFRVLARAETVEVALEVATQAPALG